jgi:hypothetical protein
MIPTPSGGSDALTWDSRAGANLARFGLSPVTALGCGRDARLRRSNLL